MKVKIPTYWSHIDPHTNQDYDSKVFKMVAVHVCMTLKDKFNKTLDEIFETFVYKALILVKPTVLETEILGDILNEVEWITKNRYLETDYLVSSLHKIIVESINSENSIKLDRYIADKCENEIDYFNTLGLLIIALKQKARNVYLSALSEAFPNTKDEEFYKELQNFL